jgi:hypothetical protein
MTDPLPWQTVAVELLRRRAGGQARILRSDLLGAAAAHERELSRRGIVSLYYILGDIDSPRQRAFQALWDAQARETRLLLQEFKGIGVEPTIIKGLEIGTRYDDGRAVGARGDVDLLVPPQDLFKTKQLLYRLGYTQGSYVAELREWGYPDYFDTIRYESSSYELAGFTKAFRLDDLDEAARAEARTIPGFCVHDDTTLVFVTFDIHHNLFRNFELRRFMERTVPSALGIGKALSPADHLWFLIHRYYSEASIGLEWSLRSLIAIAPVVRDVDVNWATLVENALEQKAPSPCFYWLTFFRTLGALSVPEETLEQLREGHLRSERNWGWQLERFFEMQPEFPHRLLGSA